MSLTRIDITDNKEISGEHRGHLKKYWIKRDKNCLVKYNNLLLKDQDAMEYFASRVHKLNNAETVNVSLGKHDEFGNCCIVESFLCENEVLLEVDRNIVMFSSGSVEYNISKAFWHVFNIFSMLENSCASEMCELKEEFIKMVFSDCLVKNQDRKLKNVGIIYNEVTRNRRLTPLFDNGLAYGAYPSEEESTVYIGNAEFKCRDVLKFILVHNYDVVKSLAYSFLENYSAILDELNLISEFITEGKREYIKNSLESTKEFIDNFLHLREEEIVK